jgi:hypothetical protein
MDDKYKLFCWILGASKKAFHVDIAKSETVSDLGKKIKEEQEQVLAGVQTDQLDLWKVSNAVIPSLQSHLISVSISARFPFPMIEHLWGNWVASH